MTLKLYLIIMSAMTFVCWFLLGVVLWTVDPAETNWIGYSLLYLSSFLAVMGSFAVLGFLLRFIVLKQILAFRAVKNAFRQSFLFALLVVISFFLLSKDLFSWLNLFFLIISLLVLEFLLLGYND